MRHLYHPEWYEELRTKSGKTPNTLARSDALKLFPIGFCIYKTFDNLTLKGQVFDYRDRFWRVRYTDQDWEELSRRELENLAKNGEPRGSGAACS